MTPRTLTFRVEGEPQPFPKKEFNSKTRTLYSRDKGGKKAAWAENIRTSVIFQGRCRPIVGVRFPRPTAISIEIWVYRTKPKSSKLPYPTTRPDLDNLCYTPHNVLQGIIYDDDSQIIHLDERKDWAGPLNPPGMQITVTEMRGE